MGVVYSTGELALGHIPGDTDHLDAAARIRDEISADPSVSLTVVHGSVPEERFNRRSDIDLLVCLKFVDPLEEPQIVDRVSRRLARIQAGHHAKIEANLWPANEHEAIRRERMYDLLFSRHLVEGMQVAEWSIGEPDETITSIAAASHNPELVRGVAINYMVYKHGGFTKAPRDFTDTDKTLSPMQRAFELPKSAARKVVQLGEAMGNEEEVRAMLFGEPSSSVISTALSGLVSLDKCYTSLLEDSLRGIVPSPAKLEAYKNWLKQAYPQAINLGIIATTTMASYIAHL